MGKALCRIISDISLLGYVLNQNGQSIMSYRMGYFTFGVNAMSMACPWVSLPYSCSIPAVSITYLGIVFKSLHLEHAFIYLFVFIGFHYSSFYFLYENYAE